MKFMMIDETKAGLNASVEHEQGAHILRLGYRWRRFGFVFTVSMGVTQDFSIRVNINPMFSRLVDGVTAIAVGVTAGFVFAAGVAISVRFGEKHPELIKEAIERAMADDAGVEYQPSPHTGHPLDKRGLN